ncbi:MAG: type VI secretion system baseplate subunit TssF [Gammaproteobacteria bacterium]|nr:type VI secretion system baseplate subunit TssF [Gammaproteobacteria bacterium]
MKHSLVKHYQNELSELEKLSESFSQAYPRIAGNLRLAAHDVEDPHIKRLIQAVALLNARVQTKLDDDFSDFSRDLLDVLYPHYQLPIPSMALVHFPSSPDLTSPYSIPQHTALACKNLTEDVSCRFQTCYDVDILPIMVSSARFYDHCEEVPDIPQKHFASSSLQLRLKCLDQSAKFADLAPRRLRFYIQLERKYAYKLYQLLFNETVVLALSNPAFADKPAVLTNHVIQSVGFDDATAILPQPAQSFSGYRLLSEFFAFPEKFLFFDLVIDPQFFGHIANTLDIAFYFKNTAPELQSRINGNVFQLGCTPIVNLFSQTAEPIRLTGETTEYQVLPDVIRSREKEIYSIEQVTVRSNKGKNIDYQKFYSMQHDKLRETPGFWHTIRRDSATLDGDNHTGSEVFMTLVDGDNYKIDYTNEDEKFILAIQAICSNGNLPRKLFQSGFTPQLSFVGESYPAKNMSWLVPATPRFSKHLQEGLPWQFVSHISANHTTLLSENGSALREMLMLYDCFGSTEIRNMISHIRGVKTRNMSQRIPGSHLESFCHGLEVTIDVSNTADAEMYMLGSILQHFLTIYSPINSFIQLVVTTSHYTKELYRWPLRIGNKSFV